MLTFITLAWNKLLTFVTFEYLHKLIKMGNWRLEAFKMSVYMMFPVGMFWYFNQPEMLEDWMISKRKELYPPPRDRREIDDKELLAVRIKEMRIAEQKKWEEQLEQFSKK